MPSSYPKLFIPCRKIDKMCKMKHLAKINKYIKIFNTINLFHVRFHFFKCIKICLIQNIERYVFNLLSYVKSNYINIAILLM